MLQWTKPFKDLNLSEVNKFVSEYTVPFWCTDGRVDVKFKVFQTMDGQYLCLTSHNYMPKVGHTYFPSQLSGKSEEDALDCAHRKITLSIEDGASVEQFIRDPNYI